MAKVAFDVAKVMADLAKMEADGYTFYEKVAKAAEGTMTQKAFEKFAQDERKHEAFYLKQLKKYEGKTYEIDQEEAKFLNLMLNAPSPLDKLEEEVGDKEVWDSSQVLKIAEKLERDTIMFLGQIMAAHDDFAKEEAFAAALKEEKEHLSTILQSQAERLSSALML
jgi:rubrerythrin